jgi:threonine aldolase
VIDFVSDNASGLCPEALDALVDARGGRAGPYGADTATERARAAFAELFGTSTEVFFVATGTAANTLALASLTRRWQRILCEEYAHLANDESTAPESVTGCRVVTVPAGGAKLTPESLERRDASLGRSVHQPAPGAVTISNPTEFGEVYGPAEVAALADAAHRHGYRLHVDGARFANAVAALDCDPRELSVDAGVDALSLGGTKNGLALGEAVLLFPGLAQADAADAFPTLRKSSGHLLSKHRYVTAPFEAVLADGAWLRHAAHANEMARRLSAGLADLGCPPRFATQANGVFATLDADVDERLRAAGWVFHLFGPPGGQAARFMTSFDTPPDRVDALLADAAGTRRE